jgi:hypothetical protein
MSKMIRISTETYDQIENIQSVLGSASKQDIVRQAIDNLNRELLLVQTDLAFRKLKKDQNAWQEELEEREAWGFLNDELKSE